MIRKITSTLITNCFYSKFNRTAVIFDFGLPIAREGIHERNPKYLVHRRGFLNRKSAIENLKCHLDDPVRPCKHLFGIVRPICFAAFRLITNSNFVACCTGKSAGLAPFKILST